MTNRALLPTVCLLLILVAAGDAPAGERGAGALKQALVDLATDIRAAAVASHPADVPWATLAHLRRRFGVRTRAICLASDPRHPVSSSTLGAAAESVGAEIVILGLPPADISRTAAEAFDVWDRKEALRRLVREIRAFRPDLLIVGPSAEPGDHRRQAVEQLTRESFKSLSVRKLFHAGEGGVTVPVDEVEPICGLSYAGMGARALAILAVKETSPASGEYVLVESRVKDGGPSLLAGLDIPRPEWLGPEGWMSSRKEIAGKLEPMLWKIADRDPPREKLGRALAAALGVAVELERTGPEPVLGMSTVLTARVRNGRGRPIRVAGMTVSTGGALLAEAAPAGPRTLAPGARTEREIRVEFPEVLEGGAGSRLPEPHRVQVTLALTFESGGPEFLIRGTIDLPPKPRFEWRFRSWDRLILPLPGEEWLDLVLVNRGGEEISGEPVVEFEGSDRLTASYADTVVVPAGGETVVRVTLEVREGIEEGRILIRVRYRDDVLTDELRVLELGAPGEVRIAVVETPGDRTFPALLAMGVRAERLTDEELIHEDLSIYETIVLGVRPFSSRPTLRRAMPRLLAYVSEGGNLVVQQCEAAAWSPAFAPFPLVVGEDRVIREDARIYRPDPEHRLLEFPNRIEEDDFRDWVLERGSGFPASFDEENFEVVLEMADPGRPRMPGILTAKYGAGRYTYTPLSWHLQLPLLNPAALRMLANLVAYPIIR